MWWNARVMRVCAVSMWFASVAAVEAQTPPLAIERDPPIGTRPTDRPPVEVPNPKGPPLATTPPTPVAPVVVPPGPGPVAVPAPVKPDAAPTPAAPAPAAPAVTTAEEVTLVARPVLFVTGVTTWDAAEEKLGGVFARLSEAAKKLGVEPTEGPLVEYIESDSDDVGFKAMLPVPAEPAGKLPKGVKSGMSPGGKALKFRHDGPIDDLEEVYSRIDDELSKRGVEAKSIVERYDPDALGSVEDRVVIDVWVVLK